MLAQQHEAETLTTARLCRLATVSAYTLYRWHKDGWQARDGTVYRLEGYRVGDRWRWVKASWEALFAAMNAPPPPRGEGKKARAAAKAATKRLDRDMGAAKGEG